MATTLAKTHLVKSPQELTIPSSSFGLLTGSLSEQQAILAIPPRENHTSGSYDQLPVGPGPGDTYFIVTGSVGTNNPYHCFVSGTWTQLAPVTTVYPLTSSAGWTQTNYSVGGGIFSGSTFIASSSNGSGGGGNTGADITQTFPIQSSNWELKCRIAKSGTTDSEWIGIITVSTGATYTYVLVRASGFVYYNTGAGLSAGSSFPVNGTGWVSIRYDGGRAIFLYGTGTTTTPPTSWTILYDAIILTGRTIPPTTISLTGRTNAGLTLTSDSSWTFANLSVKNLSVGGI